MFTNLTLILVPNTAMQYGQNISIPYTPTQTDHNFLNVDQKNKTQIKMDRDREDGKLSLIS